MGNQHGGTPAEGFNPQHTKNPRSNVSIPPSRYSSRVGSPPPATSGSEVEWATPSSSPMRVPPHSLRAALSPSVLFATALPHVGAPPSSTEFESSTDVPLKQSTHVWRQQGTSGPAGQAHSSTTSADDEHRVQSHGIHNDAVQPSQSGNRFRNTNSATERMDDRTNSRQLRRPPEDARNAAAVAGCYGSDNQSYGNHSSGMVHLSSSSINHASSRVLSADSIPEQSLRGTDTRLRAKKHHEPPPTTQTTPLHPTRVNYPVPRGILNNADAAGQSHHSGWRPIITENASTSSKQQFESALQHRSVSPPIRLQIPASGVSGSTTDGRHQLEQVIPDGCPLIASSSQPNALQQSLSPPITLRQPTTALSGAIRSMSPPINLQNRPSSPPTGLHKSVSPPINLQPPSLQRATSVPTNPPPHHFHSSNKQRRVPSSYGAVAADNAQEPMKSYLSDDKTSPRELSSSSDPSYAVARRPASSTQPPPSATSVYSHRPFSPSSIFRQQQQQQPQAPPIAVGRTTMPVGPKRPIAAAVDGAGQHLRASSGQVTDRRQRDSPALSQNDQTAKQRSSLCKHSTETLRTTGESTVSCDQNISNLGSANVQLNISGRPSSQPPGNQKSADHLKTASLASERRWHQAEGHEDKLRQTESSERRGLEMVREDIAYASMPVFPEINIAHSSDKKDELQDILSGSTSTSTAIITENKDFSSSTSLPATCSTERDGVVRADSFNTRLTDQNRKASLDSDFSISDSRDGLLQQQKQQKHLCSSASEISAMEERRRKRAALVRLRARNAPPTVNETPHDTETTATTTTTALGKISKDVGTKETHFEDKFAKIQDERTLRLAKDSNQPFKDLSVNSREQLHKMQAVTDGPSPLGGSHGIIQTVTEKQQQDKGSKEMVYDHLNSSISEKQPNADLKSKEIIEDTVIVSLVQIKSVDQGQEAESAKQQRTSESFAAETVNQRNLNLKACPAQLLATERAEFEVAETVAPLLVHEQVFLSPVGGEVLQQFTPTYQAFCFLVNRWVTKPPHRLSTERVECEVQECFVPPCQIQERQAFACAVDGQAFESLTSNLSGQENVLIHFVTSHLAPKPKEPKETKSNETIVNASSKGDLTIHSQQHISIGTATVASPAEPKAAVKIGHKVSTSASKTPEPDIQKILESCKKSKTHSEMSTPDQLSQNPSHQIASKEQSSPIQSTAVVENDNLESLPLIKKPLGPRKNEGQFNAPTLPTVDSSEHKIIPPGTIYVRSPTSDVDRLKQSVLRAETKESEGNFQEPVFPSSSEKPSMKTENAIQVKDEEFVPVRKMPQQNTMKVIVPGWEKFKAAESVERSDKNAIPGILPLVQQRVKQQGEVESTEKSTEQLMKQASTKPHSNNLEEQKSQVYMVGLIKDATEQKEETPDPTKEQNKAAPCSANIGAHAFKSQQHGKVSYKKDGRTFHGTAATVAPSQIAISTKPLDSKMPSSTSSLSALLSARDARLLDSQMPSVTTISQAPSGAKPGDLQQPQEHQPNLDLRPSQSINNELQTTKQLPITENLQHATFAAPESFAVSDAVTPSDTLARQSTVKSNVSTGPLLADKIRNRTETDDQVLLSQQLKRIPADANSEHRGLPKDPHGSKQATSSPVQASFSQETPRKEAAPKEESCASSDWRSWKATSEARSFDSADFLLSETMLASGSSSTTVAHGVEAPTQPSPHRRPILQKAKTFDVPESRPEDEDDEMFHLIIKRGPRKSDEDISESTNKRLSVAERIFKMETRVSGSDGDSPRSSSEVLTPVKKQNLFRDKPLPGSPLQKKPDSAYGSASSSNRSSMSDQLQQHLSLIAAAAEKSATDQFTQSTADPSTEAPSTKSRRTTQPVTTDEIQKAERLESVSTFRAEVLRQAAINVYRPPVDQPEKHLTSVKVKGQETFPAPFEPEKLHDRRRDPRYRTTPVTNHELYDIPECNTQLQGRGVKSREADPLRFDPYYKAGSPSRHTRLADARGQASLVRSTYTLDEETGDQEGLEEYRQWNAESLEDVVFHEDRSNWTKEERTKAETDDELCKLSLAEKLKLFSDKPEASSSQLVTPGARRKQRRLQSRFKTQSLDEEPITTEEVGKARISPLALSLVKPPPVEALRSLPVKEQREFMAQWAEMTLNQTSFSSSSSSSSSVTKPTVAPLLESSSSLEEEPTDEKKKGILKPVPETANRQPASGQIKGILKSNTSQQIKLKGILKTENTPNCAENKQMHSILKKDNANSDTDETRGGLEKKEYRLDQLPAVLRKESPSEANTSKDIGTVDELTSDQGSGILSADGRRFEALTQDTAVVNARDAVAASSSSGTMETEAEADESSSASDPTLQSRIKNKAVVRRRQQLQRQLASRPKTPPNESSDNCTALDEDEFVSCADNGAKFGRNGRHFTQPITPAEKEKLESINKNDNDDVRSSPSYMRLSERVLALQKSGETDWKQRLDSRDSSSPEDAVVVLRDRKGEEGSEPPRSRPISIADRLSLLHSAKDTWREKVEEKDITQFTVEGKISRLGVSVESPLQQRSRNSGKLTVTRAVSTPNLSVSPDDLLEDEKDRSESDDDTPSTVTIPVIDNEAISQFFSSSAPTGARLNISQADLDNLSRKTRTLRIAVRNVRPSRIRPSSGNPLRRTLEHPGLLQTYYTEVRTGVAQRELKRIKHEQILGTTHFAQEALAGLASKENFSNVTLRKTDSSSTALADKHQPFCEVMLLHVKGRRYCQTRLVEPRASSVNSGDCFILVTSDTVFLWVGEYCNVIEKAKATDIANQILQKRDLGIRSSCRLITIQEEYQDAVPETRQFWRTLNAAEPSNCSAQPPGGYNEDELYEVYISETNAVYRIKDQRLMSVEECHGKVLKFEMLRSKEAYVFDFGAEMYVWTGKHVPFDKRKKIVQLALELWNKGYNYSEFDINPFAPLVLEENGGPPPHGNERPKWALFGKINQNMETILFKEKFMDWPDSSRLIQAKGQDGSSKEKKQAEAVTDLKPFDAKLMVPTDTSPVSLVLEGSHLGRGCHWEGFEKGIRREVDILTHGIDIWHVMEFEHYLLYESSHGQLHDGDTYVIRWHYVIAQTGSRTVRSDDPRSVLGGRVRCAYFFWQGRNSSINEKCASALMTVELDEEGGPQIRVVQGKESPCFLNLFKGRMIVHIGKREDEMTNTHGQWRFYMVRNELPNEAYLLEIPLGQAQLRSRGSFLLLNVNSGFLFLWHGVKTTNQTVLRAREIALSLRERCPDEVGLSTDDPVMPFEMMEGLEHAEFWNALTSGESGIYDTLVQDPRPYSFTPRLFHLTSISGTFEATEIINPSRNNMDIVTPFPVLQSDMYNASQPALFLLDNHHEVYLWQGWWPAETEEADNVRTASAEARLLANRRCAMQTVLQYCREIDPANPPPAYVVYAGLEPVVFTNIFPVWETFEAITEAMLNDGKLGDDLELVEDAFAKLTDARYSWEELQRRPLPDGVDPLKLENYLSEEEFEEVIGMSQEDFNALPVWKQVNIKKEVGLF